MKKLLVLFLCLLLPASCFAQALNVGGSADSALVQIGTQLAAQCGYTLNCADTEESAVNAMLADTGSLCLATQQMPIRALQGYSNGDPRKDMQALTIVAKDDVFMLMRKNAAEAIGVTDLTTLNAFLEENEYGVTVMRFLDANAYDRACCTLFDTMYLDSDVYTDLDDMVSSTDDETPYMLLVGASDAMKLSTGDFVVLGCMSETRSPFFPDIQCAAEAELPVCQGVWYGVFTTAGADTSVTSALQTAANDGAFITLLNNLYLQPASMDDFQSFVLFQCADLVAYMTAEGLFFYEE